MNVNEVISVVGNSVFYDIEDKLDHKCNDKSKIIQSDSVKDYIIRIKDKYASNNKIREQYSLEDTSNKRFEARYCKEFDINKIIFCNKKNYLVIDAIADDDIFEKIKDIKHR